MGCASLKRIGSSLPPLVYRTCSVITKIHLNVLLLAARMEDPLCSSSIFTHPVFFWRRPYCQLARIILKFTEPSSGPSDCSIRNLLKWTEGGCAMHAFGAVLAIRAALDFSKPPNGDGSV